MLSRTVVARMGTNRQSRVKRGEGPRLLFIDIETSPNSAHVWGLFKQTVSLSQLMDSSRVMCWAAKWYGKKGIEFHSEVDEGPASPHFAMIKKAWEVLDAADWVCHYNGRKFDIPTLNKEFLHYDLPPPSPYKQIDLLSTARTQFRLPSNKLDYLAQFLGLKGKVKHEGHELWVKCMAGDKAAWKTMKKYNCQDTKLLESVYDRLLPWIPRHPNAGLYVDLAKPVCPKCGSTHLQKRGTTPAALPTGLQIYQRFQCQGCSSWSRSRQPLIPKEDRKNVLSTSV